MTEIARSKVVLFSATGRRPVLEQLDLVAGRFYNRDQDFRAGHARDLLGELAFLVSPMGELEPENVPPEGKRSLDIGDGNAGVIGRENAEGHGKEMFRAQRQNVELAARFGVIFRRMSRITLVTNSSDAYMFRNHGPER